MIRCKHKINEITQNCNICSWTFEQIKNEWYEFIKDLQNQISLLKNRITILENK